LLMWWVCFCVCFFVNVPATT